MRGTHANKPVIKTHFKKRYKYNTTKNNLWERGNLGSSYHSEALLALGTQND